jgi:hypothetical protein
MSPMSERPNNSTINEYNNPGLDADLMLQAEAMDPVMADAIANTSVDGTPLDIDAEPLSFDSPSP